MKQGLALNQIYCQDCLEGLRQIADETIPLAIVDPPFGPFCTYDTRCTYETWRVEKKREVGKASDSLVSETKGAEEELPETAVEEVVEGEETGDASAEDASAGDVSAEDVDALESEDVDSEEPARSEGEGTGRRLSGRKATAAYLRWAKELLAEVHRVLTPDGTLWLAMDDAFAAEFKLMMQKELHFHCENWIVWYYMYGTPSRRKFSLSHTHLFQMTKNPKEFTFNADDAKVRVPTAREELYHDKRANPNGKVPDNTWLYQRSSGTFRNSRDWHGCRMPELLLGRIIRTTSNLEDVVLDPFAGNGAVLAVAKKLGRRYIGFEISPEYCARANRRVQVSDYGDPLEGDAIKDYMKKMFEDIP